jgi:hypothetical protein
VRDDDASQPTSEQTPRRKHDLALSPSPVASARDWRDPEETLRTLFRRAEAQALEAQSWYLRDKRTKKAIAQLLRAVSIIFAAAGGIFPLISVAQPGLVSASWGYVLLAISASCVGFDKLFGVSAAWMRDIASAFAIQERLGRFQIDWAELSVLPPTNDATVCEALRLIDAFMLDLHGLLKLETTEWQEDFRRAWAQLEQGSTQPGPAETQMRIGEARHKP